MNFLSLFFCVPAHAREFRLKYSMNLKVAELSEGILCNQITASVPFVRCSHSIRAMLA